MKQVQLILRHVTFLPKELESGVLYVSREYSVVGHLCACGCGNKVIIPLSPAAWSFTERDGLPTLRPSIGNWQLPCRSHYFVSEGRVEWAGQWTEQQIAAGKEAEKARREAYYAHKKVSLWQRLWNWIKKLFGI